MNNYYLMCLSVNPRIIKIDYKNDISHTSMDKIDYMTQKYSLDELKQTLFNAGKIDSMDAEIVIMHQSKFNGKDYIKYFPLLTKEDKEYNLESVNVSNNKVKVKEVEHLIKVFFNKYKNKDFREIADFYYSDMDEHILKRIRIIFSNLFNPDKREKTLNEYVSYSEIRKFSSIIHYYEKYKKFDKYLENMNNIGRYIVNHKETLLELTNSNIITGQISFDFTNQGLINSDENKTNIIDDYTKDMISEEKQIMAEYEEIDNLKKQPWDNPLAEQYFKSLQFPSDFDFSSLTLEDQFRMGRIDAVDYRYAKMKEESKRK